MPPGPRTLSGVICPVAIPSTLLRYVFDSERSFAALWLAFDGPREFIAARRFTRRVEGTDLELVGLIATECARQQLVQEDGHLSFPRIRRNGGSTRSVDVEIESCFVFGIVMDSKRECGQIECLCAQDQVARRSRGIARCAPLTREGLRRDLVAPRRVAGRVERAHLEVVRLIALETADFPLGFVRACLGVLFPFDFDLKAGLVTRLVVPGKVCDRFRR